jgi:hypothetical protein
VLLNFARNDNYFCFIGFGSDSQDFNALFCLWEFLAKRTPDEAGPQNLSLGAQQFLLGTYSRPASEQIGVHARPSMFASA